MEQLEDRILLSITLSGVPDWTSQGPAPIQDAQTLNLTNNPVSGAIQRIAVNPGNPKDVYVGAVNGGIWHNSDITASPTTWTPLLDQYPSLSIGALAFSPLDSTDKTLFAGIGRFSSGFKDGGPQNGVLKTTDGGIHWTLSGQSTLNGWNATSIVPTSITTKDGQLVLLATNGGVFLSTNGGDTFNRVTVDSSDSSASVSDLIADPGNGNRFFAALPGLGVYQGLYDSSTQSISWTQINGTGTNTLTGLSGSVNIKLAIHNSPGNNILYAGIVGSNKKLSNVFRSPDQGTNWSQLGTAPDVNQGGQGRTNFSIVADPAKPNLVYVGGDDFSSSPFVGNLSMYDTTTGAWAPITKGGANNTAPHADSRFMVFDNGNILESDDGGIYQLTNPETDARTWSSLVGNLQVTEFYSVAYDSINNTIIGGSQDTGPSYQTATNSQTWNDDTFQGDGNTQAVDNTGPDSIHYVLGDNFKSFGTRTFDNTNKQVSTATVQLASSATPGTALSGLDSSDKKIGFDVIPFVLNSIAPKRILIGHDNLYEDDQTGAAHATGDIIQNITPTGQTKVTALVYGGTSGGKADPGLIYVGIGGGLWLRPDDGSAFQQLTKYTGGAPEKIAIDPQDWHTVYVVDGSNVYRGTNVGTGTEDWKTITGNLDKIDGELTPGINQVSLRSVAFVQSGDTTVILVGGRTGLYKTLDPTAGTNTVWTRVSGSLQADGTPGSADHYLPHVPVNDVHYITGRDLLLVGTFGRGAWTISNAAAALATTPKLVINGDADSPNENDTFDLRLDPNNSLVLQVFINKGQVTDTTTTPNESVDLSAIQEIDVNGLGGSNRLIIDSTNGPINVVNGIIYNGGTDVTKTNGLTLVGGSSTNSFTNESSTPTGSESGTITIDNGGPTLENITYSNLQSIEDTVFVTTHTINSTAAAEPINIVDHSPKVNGFQATEVNSGSSATFALIDFANKSNVIVNGVGGSDTFLLNNPNPAAGLTSLTLNGSNAGNIFNVQAEAVSTTINTGTGVSTVNVGSKEPAINGNVVSIQGALTVNGSSAATLNVDDSSTLGPKSGTLTPTTLTGLGMGASGITFSGLVALNLNMGPSALATDTFDITNVNVSSLVTGPRYTFLDQIPLGKLTVAGNIGSVHVNNGTPGSLAGPTATVTLFEGYSPWLLHEIIDPPANNSGGGGGSPPPSPTPPSSGNPSDTQAPASPPSSPPPASSDGGSQPSGDSSGVTSTPGTGPQDNSIPGPVITPTGPTSGDGPVSSPVSVTTALAPVSVPSSPAPSPVSAATPDPALPPFLALFEMELQWLETELAELEAIWLPILQGLSK